MITTNDRIPMACDSALNDIADGRVFEGHAGSLPLQRTERPCIGKRPACHCCGSFCVPPSFWGFSDSLRPLRMTAIFAVVVAMNVLLVTACGSPQPTAPAIAAEHDDHDDERVVHIADADLEALGIVIETAGPGRLAVTAELPGEVQVDGDRMAHVAPRVGGVVREVRASLGDTVRRGQLLAVLSSRELADAKATYLAATERLRMADATFSREERLFEGKISSEQDYLDAKRNRAEGRIESRASEQKLLALGVTAEEIGQLPDSHDVALTDYRLLSPFDGTVIDRHIKG